ncbi:MAG: alkaline phosphatase family protein, partial [Verrucomicrobia bacterium]|nr:alkaline phosphatase family protein [Verrucomicrobiota bacterium]
MSNIWAGLILGIGLVSGWAEEPVSRIGFGSCYKPEKSTPLWGKVTEFDPQVWLWLGDNVYVDFLDGKYVKANLDPKAFEKGYQRMAKSEGMATLKRLSPGHTMAVWDDHDYGLNDAGKNWERKSEAKKAFKRVRVVLLDTRFNRDDPGPNGDILGAAQWNWLEGELRRPGAELIVIGSSIQVLANQHRFEKWGNFPKSRDRLFRVIRESKARGVIFVTGDRHNGEISCQKDSDVGYPLYDVTSSGLTEVSSLREETNSLRV